MIAVLKNSISGWNFVIGSFVGHHSDLKRCVGTQNSFYNW